MDAEWVLRIILFGIVHWVLAGLTLSDLAARPRVFGGHKPPWVITVVLIPCFGSLLYLLFHPQILSPGQPPPRRNRRKDNKPGT